MTRPGGRVGLRRPVAGDSEARRAFGHSAEIRKMYGAVGEPPKTMTAEEAEAWVSGLMAHPCAWVILSDDAVVGEARLDGLNLTDRRARLALGLFGEDMLGQGIGRRAVRLVLRHAFEKIGLHRVDLRVLAYNTRAIRCYEACGFVREGIERESALVGETWEDDWIMAILEPDFRALE
jgi:RimJ/RimL family protein N-acetyltransferase